ncbi:MAG: glycosyltransferase [Solirubrobacteraceae bacterium]|nr:glycosyltransferase [Solirubrobacteraceae bacterium]
MTDSGPLLIAQICPRPIDDHHEASRHTRLLAAGLAERGHQVVIVAPSRDRAAIRSTRTLLSTDPMQLVPEPGGTPTEIAIGEASLPVRAGRREGVVPVDVARTLETLFEGIPFDLCHLHDPLPPSVTAAALKASGALNVATFHGSPHRTLTTPITKRMREQRFGRLDARLATSLVVAHEVESLLGGTVTPIAPGVPRVEAAAFVASPTPDAARAEELGPEPLRIAYLEHEERAAMRTVLRALRMLPAGIAWEARLMSARGPSASAPLPPELTGQVTFLPAGDETDEQELLDWAQVAVFASDGSDPEPTGVVRAIAAGAVPIATRLAAHLEVIGEDERGLRIDVRSPQSIATSIELLATDRARLQRLHDAGATVRAAQRPARVVDAVVDAYRALLARRRDPAVPPAMLARLRDRELIDVDLHMHTDWSHDCATPVEVLLATAKERGLGAIAVTDHNVIGGAYEAAELSERYGVKVIIGEEVKTASQGEVIGLFINEEIPRGLSLQETIAEIKRQGGVVYVPHPFDRMHAVPDYEHLLDVLDDIDAIEVFNPRVAVGTFNDEARRFATKYRLAQGAGSDAHVAQGLGSVRIRMPDFDGPEEFLAGLRIAEIAPRPASLLYVQALKFLETKATPSGARRARNQRRVRRAERGVERP